LNPSPELAQILERFPRGKRENLIPILQEAQEAFGYLSQETMQGIGSWLGLASSKIYGVATFYNQFRFEKKGAMPHARSAAARHALRRRRHLRPRRGRRARRSRDPQVPGGARGSTPTSSKSAASASAPKSRWSTSSCPAAARQLPPRRQEEGRQAARQAVFSAEMPADDVVCQFRSDDAAAWLDVPSTRRAPVLRAADALGARELRPGRSDQHR
jgi:hypothetical protein